MTLFFILGNIAFNILYYFVFQNPWFIPLNLILSLLSTTLILLIIIIIVAQFFPLGKPTSKLKYRYIQSGMKLFFRLMRVKPEVINKENIPAHNNFALFPNHKSYCDIMAMLYATDKPISAVGKKEVYKVPVLRKYMKGLNVIALDRDNDRKALEQILQAVKNLKNGLPMLIFPEGGRRNKDVDEMVDIKAGAYKLATKNKADIVPVALINFINIKHNVFKRKTPVKIIYCKPLTYDDYKEMSTQEIGEYVFNTVNNTIKEYKNK